MQHQNSSVSNYLPASVRTLIFICVFCWVAAAQTTSPIDGSTPSGLSPGAPSGSYSLSEFENINLYNGSLNFSLALLQHGGRGSIHVPTTLTIERHWMVKTPKPLANCELTGTCDRRFPASSLWSNPEYGPGVLKGRSPGVSCLDKALMRLTFTAPDGTEFELRDQLYNGQPRDLAFCYPRQGVSRGTVFVTADGTAATFISDSPIVDGSSDAPTTISPWGYLMLRDGTRYRIEDGLVKWIRDRNGNRLTFSYSGSRVIAITDSLNRQVTFNYSVAEGYPYNTSDQITFKGFAGASRTIRVSKDSLANALRNTRSGDSTTTKTFAQLFPELPGSPGSQFNPTIVSSLWLPDGRRYRFYYNVYGELARVELPTGGVIEYDFANVSNPNDGIYRRLIERRVYSDGTTLSGKTTYSDLGGIQVDSLDANGALLARSKHYFYGNPLASLSQGPTWYSSWQDAREYKTEEFASDGVTVLRQINNTWQQRTSVSWWNSSYGPEPPNDPRVIETTTTLEPGGANLVSKQTFGYDDIVPYNNRNNVKQYDFGPGAPGALLRETRTTYLTNSSYTDPFVHLRSIPTQTSIFDSTGIERARTVFEYDNYTKESNDCEHSFHCLQARPSISGLCAVVLSPTDCDNSDPTQVTRRGNVTAVTRYVLSGGSAIGISSYSQYDVAGNLTRSIDPRSTLANIIATTIDYDDRFGAPDNEAQSNTAPAELGGPYSFAFPTKVINALGHTSYTQFDYYLGQPINTEDANGVVASISFNDLLDRPTQMIRAANQGASVKNQTTFSYNDDNTSRTITTTSDQASYGDNILKSDLVYDGLGRTIVNRRYDTTNTFISVLTDYDALGRAYKVSNPFGANEDIRWTITGFDALSRVTSVTTPDTAVVTTAYDGNRVLVADQNPTAQNRSKRISRTNALGQLTDVWEITAPDSATESVTFPSFGDVTAGYRTSYNYDTLGNLTRVTQGTQQRFFLYDSLSRLIRARNPEQNTYGPISDITDQFGNSTWSVKYVYDVNGNLTQKTDARGIISTYAYDALNRNTTIDFSDTSSINPDVTRSYDSATKGVGRIASSYAGGGESVGSNVEKTSIDSYDALGRPTIQRQLFKLNGAWAVPQYVTTRTYNLAGAVTSQTYPSGYSVNYSYDSAGRTNSFSGNLGGNTSTYSTGILYSPFGGMAKEQLGTTTPVYNKLFYNNRGQLAEIRESTSYTGPTDTTWNRGAIINHYSTQCSGACLPTSSMTDNNGNLKKQEVYIPNNEQIPTTDYTMRWQEYNYDSLNRLNWVREISGGAEVWKQKFSYDRYGNRTIDHWISWGPVNQQQFTVNTTNNRLGVPGDQTGVMNYDPAGNLINDTYTGAGTRTYDAENRMTQAWGGNNQLQYYTYNADGQRVRRKIDGVETWQVYGFDGELLAEYPAQGATGSPQKEYGYRNGQLLVVATAGNTAAEPVTWTNAVGVSVSGNTLTKTAAYGWGNAGASSTQAIASGDGYVEFTAAQLAVERICGLSHGDSNQSQEDVDFGILLSDGGFIYAWESGVMKINAGAYSTSDKLRVAVEAGQVKYYKNGTLFYTSSIAPVYPLIVDTAIRNTSASISNVVISGTSGVNVASSANGATATASSTYSGQPASNAINGDRKGTGSSWWTDNTSDIYPDWIQVDFSGTKTISEVDVIGLQQNPSTPVEPDLTMTSRYALTDFEVKYWTGSAWATIPGASVTGNDKVWRKLTFSPVATTKILLNVTRVAGDNHTQLVEIEAYNRATSTSLQWLVTDQLGTPRMIFDQSGSLANMKRHDYLPFGEELFAGIGGRSTTQGYTGDGVRQQFTQKERDNETGLDYFLARYYSSTQGRFTSPDEFKGGPDELYDFADDASANPTLYADLNIPQSLNKYQYSYNNPLRYVDPNGHDPDDPSCPCTMTPAQAEQAKKAFTDALDAVADATGITAVAEGIREYGPKVIKAILDAGPKSAAQLDSEDLRLLRPRQHSEDTNSQAPEENSSGRRSQAFTPSDKAKIDAKSNPHGSCQDCGRETVVVQSKKGQKTPDNQRQRHHIRPQAEGGTRDVSNGVTLCKTCHDERHRRLRETQADRARRP